MSAVLGSNTNGIFWLVAVAMAALALIIVALPFLKNQKTPAKTTLIVGILLPTLAVGMYLYLGSPSVESAHPGSMSAAQSSRAASDAAAKKPVGSVSSMIDGLAERLEREPDDGKGWLLLAKSYKHLNRTSDAIAAYDKAVALGEFDAVLAELSGSFASAHAQAAQIYGKVSLAENAQDIVEPTDTVFIFARAINGPPMPVAVLQRSASDLPFDFVLDDSQAMAESSKLSDFEQVVVTARISRSGNATEALQGLEARSGTVIVQDNEHLDLRIVPRD
jgi:tetratricopeptide (TPR) repeat protein